MSRIPDHFQINRDHPLFVIDFEASSLASNSYPIEIGVASWAGEGEPILGWSSLIHPIDAWRANDSWTKEASAIHGITREELKSGLTPHEALTIANRIIGNSDIYCDGGLYDQHWLGQLSLAAGIYPSFRLRGLEHLLSVMSIKQQTLFHLKNQGRKIAHRAKADAQDLIELIAKAFEVPVSKEDLIIHQS